MTSQQSNSDTLTSKRHPREIWPDMLSSGCSFWKNTRNTVDGRNSAPVDMANIPLFTKFFTSQVVQDFFHQQYQVSLFQSKAIIYLVVSTHSKNISQIGSFPQVGLKIKHIWKHHLVILSLVSLNFDFENGPGFHRLTGTRKTTPAWCQSRR